ncbi:hypothetical protein LS684_14530 [Cytobacillus spongiae]|jgi:hypothetical protein|uniref:hypothetical protein n=1 Tax=Cytobacillus spongiae TaxID=2901381 RepID=UPI001F272C5F|nr:hypothetical protein [Cytobacillus spongiae]UII54866.1 hypothetical protein LS684_14530 [Cytobacillus spongiae]
MKTKAYIVDPYSYSEEPVRYGLKLTPGLWVEGKMYWLMNGMEKLLHEEEISIQVKQEQIHSKARYFDMYVTNHLSFPRKVKLFFMYHHEFSTREHFSFISPSDNVIFHLANSQVFLVNARTSEKRMGQCTIQPYWDVSTGAIWSNKEKGFLKYAPMAKGTSASICSLDIEIPGNQTRKGSSWMIEGSSKTELLKFNQALLKNTLAFPFKK